MHEKEIKSNTSKQYQDRQAMASHYIVRRRTAEKIKQGMQRPKTVHTLSISISIIITKARLAAHTLPNSNRERPRNQ